MAASNTMQLHHEYVSQNEPKFCGKFLLGRLGEFIGEAEYKIDEPEQGGYKILGAVSGKGVVTVRGESYPIQGNRLILIRPNEAYSITADAEEPVRCFYISWSFLDKGSTASLADMFWNLLAQQPVRQAEGSVEIRNLYGRLARELFSTDEFSGRMLELYIEQLLLLVCRSFSLTDDKWRQTQVGAEGNIVERIVGLLEANCGTMKKLTDLSKMLGYSYPYLSHVFSQRMGKSIKTYYQELVFERAVEMLKADMSITQISEQLGYQAIHSFSRAFSTHYGVSPSRYMENLKRETKTHR